MASFISSCCPLKGHGAVPAGTREYAGTSVSTERSPLPGLFGNHAEVPTPNMHRNVPTGTKAR